MSVLERIKPPDQIVDFYSIVNPQSQQPSCDHYGRRRRLRNYSSISKYQIPTEPHNTLQMLASPLQGENARFDSRWQNDNKLRNCQQIRRYLHSLLRDLMDILLRNRIQIYGCCKNSSMSFKKCPRINGDRTKRRRRRTFHPLPLMLVIELLLLMIILVVDVHGSNPTYNFCYSQLSRADANGDDAIDRTEWDMVVKYVSGGTVTSDALDTTSLFSIAGGSDSISISTVKDSSNNHAFCQSLYETILSASSIQLDTAESKCLYAMSIGDANRDSALGRLVEYPRYTNQVSGNIYGFTTSYAELPALVQALFDEFVDDVTADTISIVGSKSSETLSSEQALKLKLLCQQTAIAILAASGDAGDTPLSAPVSTPFVLPSTTAPVAVPLSGSAPVPAPIVTPAATETIPTAGVVPDGFIPTFTITVCLQKIAFSDGLRDDMLSSSEYYAFINRLTDDAFAEYSSFDTLPESIRSTFTSLAGGSPDGTVNVYGSKPGQTASQEDTDRLNQFCTLTDVAIQGVLANDDVGDTPIAAPTVAANPSPTENTPTSNLSYEDCIKSMIVADLSRDSLLNDKEFVRFLSRIKSDIQATDEFSSLQQADKDLFVALALVNGEIDVTGSKPNETPTAEQKVHLESICNQVGAALVSPGNPSTIAPTTTNASSGTITVYNSFVIFNSMQLNAETLKPSHTERDGLSKAYVLFVKNAIMNYTAAANTNSYRNLLAPSMKAHVRARRRLPISGIVQDSPNVYLLNDLVCPESVNKSDLCQVAYASFVADFADMSEEIALKTLTNYTQSLLDPLLEGLLLSINPKSAIRVAGLYDKLQPSEKGTSPPKIGGSIESGDDGDGPNVVQIIGGLVIVAILIACPVYYWKTRHTKRKPKVRTDAMHAVEGSDKNGEYTVGVESAPSTGITGKFDKDDHSIDEDQSDDDDESNAFSAEDDSPINGDQQGKPGGKKFKPFRLGKKKDSSAEDDIRILESNDGLPEGTEDFGIYEFEEPSELWNHQIADNDWGDNQWGMVSASGHNRGDGFDSLAMDPKTTRTEDENEQTEWTGSHSESSGSNSAFGTGSVISGASGNVGQLGGLVDNGQWNGVLQTAAQLENNLAGSVSSHNSDERSNASNKSESETSFYPDSASDFVDDPFDDRTQQTGGSMTSEELRRREMYRVQIEELVRKAAPDEIGNVKIMMEQFIGREAELINTLQTMHERTISQRRLQAVHKSKAIRERDSREFATAGAESSAVIAAASMINSDEDMEEFEDDGAFDEDNSYYDDDDHDESASGTRSYDDDGHDDSASGTRSYDDDNEREDFDDEDDRSRSGSYDDDEKSYRSYDDDDRSESRSHSGSYEDDQEGSAFQSQGEQCDDEIGGSATGSRTGSYDDDDRHTEDERDFTGSRSGSGSKERSYVYDDGDGSYYSDEE